MRNSPEINECKRHGEGPYHNCTYVDRRNSLIPVAQQEALNTVAGMSQGLARELRYQRVFHDAMNRLAIEAGIGVAFR